MTTTLPAPTALKRTPSQVLADVRSLVSPGLQAAVAELDHPVRDVASYHFGWTTADGRPDSGGAGKMYRAALAVLAAGAVTGSGEHALPGAVALELAHNSSLLQDDVMDRDRVRRHRPTAWTVFGKSEAILAGDALLIHALKVLLQATAGGIRSAVVLADAYQRMIVGQSYDVGFERRTHVTLEESIQMASDKTAALIAASTAIGAILAGADDAVISAMTSFGWHIGLAFQIADDVLGIWGDSAQTGKPVGADIAARKKSVPVAHALSAHAPVEPLARFYSGTRCPSSDEVAAITAQLTDMGTKRWAEQAATDHLDLAAASLAAVALRPRESEDLMTLALSAVNRAS